MNRRRFLASLPALYSATLVSAPASPGRLLVVFLRGGYDAANVLIPIASRDYYELRPNIAVGRDAALSIDSDWGLHPALRESVHPLYLRGEAAFIAFAGTDNLSRSHFETQDSIELGQPAGARAYTSGFMNRLAMEIGAAHAISFTNQLPVAFRGTASVTNLALGATGRAALDARQSALIAGMYKDTPYAGAVSEGFAARETVMRELGEEMVAASRNAVNARGFVDQAPRMARLMRGEYRLGFVDVGGWDTHVGEGGAQGYLALRLDELGRGLAAFAAAMEAAWRDTVVVVISEFGRTFRENGNRGTDHGHGTVYWVLGGGVRGARVAGEQARVARATLFQDRDYPVLNDYRGVLAGLFSRLYGLGGPALANVFPAAAPRDFALL
jgi:uncharacterized protein (DUF1501 family)